MSRFFNFSKDNQNNLNNNMNDVNNTNQNYIAPNNTNNPYNNQQYNNDYNNYNNQYNQVPNQNNQYIQNNSNNESNPETFVYNSYPNNVNNSDNFESMRPLENYMPTNQSQVNPANTPSNYPTDVLEDSEILDMPNTQNSVVPDQTQPKEPVLDPLNNANNPIPVNPVAEVKENYVEEELPTNFKANIFSVIGMMIGMIFNPGTTIVSNSKKYRSTDKALMVTIWITVVTLVLCIGARILVGSFSKTYSSLTSSYRINLDFANISALDNYLPYLIIAFVVSFGCIIITSLIYYASSFLNSKGVPFGSYLMVSNLALLPFIIGVMCLYPIANLVSSYLGLLALIFAFLYTLVSFLTGIGEVLTFKNINREILYNVLNISVIVLVMIMVFVFLINSDFIVLPELSL